MALSRSSNGAIRESLDRRIFRIGEVARLLGVPVRRIDEWVRVGWLEAEKPRRGPGYYKMLSERELAVARRVARRQQEFGVRATAALFRRVREMEAHGQPTD